MNKIINVKPLLISGAIVAPLLVFAGFVQAARQVSLTWQAISTACVNTWNMILGLLSHPTTIIIAAIAVLLGIGLLRGIFFIAWQFYKTKRLQRSLNAKVIQKHRLNKQYKSIQVVDAKDPFAVTLGIRKPSIYVSTGLLKQLSDQETASVIAHEQHHLRHKHTFNNMLAHLVRSFIFFVPVMPALADSIILKQELEADNEAILTTSRASLATAILKTMEGNICQRHFPVSAAPFSLMTDRTRAVLGEQVSVVANVTKKIIIVSVFMVGAITMFLARPHTEYISSYSATLTESGSSSTLNYCYGPNESLMSLFGPLQHQLDSVSIQSTELSFPELNIMPNIE